MDQHVLVIADMAGVIRHWSVGAETLIGYPASQAVGTTLDLIVPEEFRAAHWMGFRRAMEVGEAEIDGTTTELPVRCAHGGVEVFSVAVTLLRDPSRSVVGAMIIGGPKAADA